MKKLCLFLLTITTPLLYAPQAKTLGTAFLRVVRQKLLPKAQVTAEMLHTALRAGDDHLAMVYLKETDPNKILQHQNALHVAASSTSLQLPGIVFPELVALVEDINTPGDWKRTALAQAIHARNWDGAEQLALTGACGYTPDYFGETPIKKLEQLEQELHETWGVPGHPKLHRQVTYIRNLLLKPVYKSTKKS